MHSAIVLDMFSVHPKLVSDARYGNLKAFHSEPESFYFWLRTTPSSPTALLCLGYRNEKWTVL